MKLGLPRRTGLATLATGACAAVLLTGLLTGCSVIEQSFSDPFDATLPAGTEVPLKMPVINDSRPYLTLDTSIGGAPAVPMLLDTASPGIRILKDQLGAADVVRTTTPVNATFVDGTTFDGVIAQATVSFAGLASDGPIDIQLITEVSCQPEFPKCAGADGLKAYSKAQSFAGIFGIGLMSQDVYSPLSQLAAGPASSFSIASTPSKGRAMMTLNQLPPEPPEGTAASYSMAKWPKPLPNGVPAWSSNEVNACWGFGIEAPTCVATAFDTGSPFTYASSSLPGAPASDPAAGQYRLNLYTTEQPTPVWSVLSGNVPGKNQIKITGDESPKAVNTGSTIFRDRLVTFDVKNGRVLVSTP